jgi:hypothetical protein
MVCKGKCEKYKAKKPQDSNRYKIGQKRCQICSVWVNYDGYFCPCCNSKLRNKSRKNKIEILN